MQHLRVLEHGGLVMPVRDGRQRFNYLNPVPIQQIFDRWVNRHQGAWMESLVTLKDQLEKEPETAPRQMRARRKRA
jgi:hypothetical protein